MDVWKNSSGSNGDSSQKFVQLLIVLDGKGDVSWDDSGLLVVSGGVTGKFQDLSAQVFENGGEVDSGSDSGSLGVSTLLQVSSNSGDWELKTGLGGGAYALSRTSSTLTLSS